MDIEEHKDILQKIYDDKLVEKTEQLEEIISQQLAVELEAKYEAELAQARSLSYLQPPQPEGLSLPIVPKQPVTTMQQRIHSLLY